MCEPDPDVNRWVLNFLDVDQLFSSTYYGDTNQHNVNITRAHYVGDNHWDAEFNSIENDEIIAHTLQEELSHMSLVEGTEFSNTVEDTWQASTGTQDWSSTATRNYYDAHEDGLHETDETRPSCSCSSPEGSCDGEEFNFRLEITDESELDGEVEKRLNQMVSAPHVPRTNGNIPSIDEATSDHQRLLDRLQLYNLAECKVQGDGNCQQFKSSIPIDILPREYGLPMFRALSDQFYRSPEHHKFVRRQVVNQLKSHLEVYEGYVPMAYGDYLKKMSKSGEWGDHVTLQAAADSVRFLFRTPEASPMYGVKIFVLTSFKDTCSIEILPKAQKSKRVIFLSFWAEVHYNSIYPQGELPPGDYKRKKRWWLFRNKQ